MNITVRKEVITCRKCKHKVEFLYISDFSYGERLALYDNGKKYAYINLLKDEIYNQFVEEIEIILQEKKENIGKEKEQEIVDMTFKIACDKINGSEVDFICNRKCEHCESEEVEDLLVEPEQIVCIDMPEITHNNWNTLSGEERRQTIINFFKLNKILY